MLFLATGDVRNQRDTWRRCVAIKYNDNNNRGFVFTARRWQHTASSYICQLRQGLPVMSIDECSILYRAFVFSAVD